MTDPPHSRHGRRRGRRKASRTRWLDPDGSWHVRARVERFVEPALLLVVRDGATHGYDIAEAIEELAPDDKVDLGNLYRLLRTLEDEGAVTSEWRDDLPGRSKRTYELTELGRSLLDGWASALADLTDSLSQYAQRYRGDRR